MNRSQGTLSRGSEEIGSEIIRDEKIMKRIEELVASDRSSTMPVRIQGTEEEEVCGEVYSCYLKEPARFSGMGGIVLRLDEVRNWVGMPYATADPRFLSMETERRYRETGSHHSRADRSNLTYAMGQVPFKQASKTREALIVYMEYRQLFSLQGSIRGKITKGKVVDLRSALEPMRMISMTQL